MNENCILHAGKPTRSLFPYETNPRQRILVAEDNYAVRLFSTELLKDSGYEVDAAEDGEVAWDALQPNSYDLLITENKMPKLSGVGLLRKMFAAQMTLPVIMVSETMPMDELKRQPWLHVEAMLDKSYPVEELLATVRNVLLANYVAHDEVALPSIWQSQPSAVGLQL
jgi:two-component system response regulator (stage 0 sporulation protein F)